MSVPDELPDLPTEADEEEADWQVVKNKQRGRISPIPPLPPPAWHDLAHKMWHMHRHDRQPVIETGKTLKSSWEYNKMPTMANFRDKRVDRKEEQHCAAQAQEYEKQRTGAQGREDLTPLTAPSITTCG